MKKSLSVLIFLSISVWCQGQVYRSNASGMELEQIDSVQREEFTWIMEVTREEGSVNRILFRDGVEKKRWILLYDRKTLLSERLIEKDLDSEFITYRPDGRIQTLVLFDDEGKIKEQHSYNYQENLLSSIDVSDSQGQNLYRDVYFIRNDGSLRRILRLSEDDSFILGWRHNAGFTKRDGKIEISFFGSEGLPELIEVWDGSLLEEQTDITRFEEGGSLRRWTSFITNQSTLSRWNEQGQLVSEESFQGDLLASSTLYFYDDRNLLVRKEFSGQGKKEHYVYIYTDGDEEGIDAELIREDYFKNGVLYSQVYYTGPGAERRDYYRQGELFLQVFYEEQQIVKEILIKNSEIIRERIRE